MSEHLAEIYRRGFRAGWERPDRLDVPDDLGDRPALDVLHVALSALVRARIYADERPEWTTEVEAAIDRVSAYIGDVEYARRGEATVPKVENQAPVFRGVHILRGPLPPCDSDGGCGAGYGSACRPGCPAQPRYV